MFDQPNLATFLKEIESCVENNHSPTHYKYNSHWASSLPPLSPTSNWSSNTSSYVNKPNSVSPRALRIDVNGTSFLNNSIQSEKRWHPIVRQKIFELEGPNFCYKALFMSPPAAEVYDLIYHIKRNIVMAQDLLRQKQQEEAQLTNGFWASLKSLWNPPCLADEFTMVERTKVPSYLEVSLQNLKDIFQINEVK